MQTKQQIGFLLQGPASENQVIMVITPGTEIVDSGFSHIKKTKELQFYIPLGIYDGNKDTFAKIVASVKKI